MTPARAIRQSIAVGLVVALFGLPGCGSSHSRCESYMASGQRYLAAGNLDKASVEFRNALQIEPKNGDALYFNGKVAERRGNIRDAVNFYQAALDTQFEDTRSRASLAKMFVLGGATQRALEVIAPGLQKHPDNADLLAARAAARHQLNDEPDARRDAERAVQVAPTNENAIGVLAALALRAGDSAGAVSLVSNAVAKAPDSVDLRQILVSVYLSTDQPGKAEEQMRKIVALEPSEMAPRMQLAAHLAKVNELDEAQQVLEAAVNDMPHRDSAKLALIDFISLRRSREAGEKALRGFLAKEPGNEDLRLALGSLLQRVGATQDAIATFREVIRRDGTGPKGLAARDRIAAMDIVRGHEDEAKKLIQEVLAESPRDDDALIMRANIALAHNELNNAINDFRAVLRDQPKSMVLQRSLARAYLAKNEPAMAEEALRAAVDAAPDVVSTRIELGQFLTQTNRAAQAVTLLEETVRKAPNEAQAREALIRAYIADHNLPAARTAAEDLKTLRPDSFEGYYLAGLIAHDEGRFKDGEQNLERALELQPGSAEILAALTRHDFERGRGVAAIARLQHVLERDPDNVKALDLLGDSYLQTRDLKHAIEVLTRAVTVDPASWLAHRDLGRARLAADDVSGALVDYRRALKLAPMQPVVVTELAGLYERQGLIDAAIACYEPLSRGDSTAQQLAANNIAMLLVTYKTDQASLDRARDLTTAFELSDNASLLDTLGWVHFKRRKYRDAVIVLERAADRSPDSKVIRYHLGMAQLRVGEREHARTNLETALSGSDNFTGAEEARSALARLEASRTG